MAQFGTITADGDTEEVTIKGNDGGWVHYSGVFDGATITLYFLGLDNAWHAFSASDKSAADDFQVEVPHGVKIKGTLSGVGASTSVYWQIHSVSARF